MSSGDGCLERVLRGGAKVDASSPYPVYMQLRDILRAAIVAGGDAYRSLPTEMELCGLYGLSRDSVRKALAALESEGLSLRIKRKGTFVNHAALPRRTGAFDRIGVLWPYSEMWRGCVAALEGEIVRNGYRPRVTSYPWEDLNAELDLLQEFRGTCAGVILYPHKTGGDLGYLRRLDADGYPLVLIDLYHHEADLCSVSSGNFDGAREAVLHLFGHGRRRVALAENDHGLSSDVDRRAGYLAAHAEAGVPADPALALTAPGPQDFERLLAAGRVDAVFCSSHDLVHACYRAAAAAGLAIPGDLAVAAFDSVKGDSVLSPSLTTVVQQQRQMGEEAARLLLDRVDGVQPAARRVFVPTTLNLQASCGCQA